MKINESGGVFRKDARDGLLYADILDSVLKEELPIRVGGLPFLKENRNWHRLPDRYREEYSKLVRTLACHTSGGALLFRTNAGRLGFKVTLEEPDHDTNMSFNGIMGLDVWTGRGDGSKAAGLVSAPLSGDRTEGTVWLDGSLQEVSVYLPLYSGIRHLEIGFPEDAVLEAPSPLPIRDPVGFYGSSITQGGSAGRAGTDYAHMLARKFGFDICNFGFSGAGLGEERIASIIAGIPMSVFVLDYDHNAPDPDHLRSTHERFFTILREAQPELPVIMMSKADTYHDPHWRERRDIIAATYANAVARGDRNVYFVDGSRMYGTDDLYLCTVDGTHPNELGFHKFYEALSPIFASVLGC